MMDISNKKIPSCVQAKLRSLGIEQLRPSQQKAIKKGLFSSKNILVCTPTASGKTLVGELGIFYRLQQQKTKSAKGVYVVPLRALAAEKYKDFKKRFPEYSIALTSGDMDSDDAYLADYDIIITTSEKLDSLIRHQAPWISMISCLVVDEIHLLNDVSRGPTLEVVITILRKKISEIQIIGLSATIGNAAELASWLDAQLVEDLWRPVALKKGVFHKDTIYFEE